MVRASVSLARSHAKTYFPCQFRPGRTIMKLRNDVTVRAAVANDATQMSRVLSEILTSWNSDRPSSPEFVRALYIEHQDQISCLLALDQENRLLGFQSLKTATPGNPYDVPVGWGIIGTYVDALAVRRGVGRLLFVATLRAAKAAGLVEIDATIGEGNGPGLGYYQAMGFEPYMQGPGVVRTKRSVDESA